MKYRFLNINLLIIFFFIVLQGYLGWVTANNTPDDYDGIMFAQTWLPAHCQIQDKSRLTYFCSVVNQYERWSIHGVWPFKHRGNSPEFCATSNPSKELLNMVEINQQIPDLRTKWVDIYAVNDRRNVDNIGQFFWEREWKKHGTCAYKPSQTKPQQKYFKKALELYDNFNMDIIIKLIRLSPIETYTSQRIIQKINNELKDNQFMCVTNQAGDQFLIEVRTCLDKIGNLADCPTWGSSWSACGLTRPIIFPHGLIGQPNTATRGNSGNTGIGGNARGSSQTFGARRPLFQRPTTRSPRGR